MEIVTNKADIHTCLNGAYIFGDRIEQTTFKYIFGGRIELTIFKYIILGYDKCFREQ